MTESLSKQVFQGGAWTFALRGSKRVLDFLRTIILARFLAPSDFGLMGIALITLQTLEVFSQTGFQAAIIQKQDATKDHLNVAWTLLAIRGVALFGLMIAVAPVVAIFFRTPDSRLLVQALGLSFLLQGFVSIGIVSFQKELNFKKQYLYEINGFAFDFLVSIILVFVLKSVWALVIGRIVGDVSRLISSYFLAPYRPRLDFHMGRARELHRFGRWVSGSSIMSFIVTQGDSVLVGRLLGPASLGIYKMASTISNLPATDITHVVAQVAFPAYSKIQDEIIRLRRAFLKTLRLTVILSAILAVVIAILVPKFTRLFLGEKWLPMIIPVQILVFAGFIRSLQAVTGPLFYSIGKPRIDAIAQTIRLGVFLALLYPFVSRYGMAGAAFSVLISVIFSSLYAFINLHGVFRIKS